MIAAGDDRYRPFLDGLRTVAVYLVVAFHAGTDRLPGGYLGVDVFFVLSGFLVTQLLLRDIDGEGSVAFRRFYARRVRRLLPAALVTLVVTALVFSALASPVEVADAERSFRAAFLYVANWHFIGEASDYFGADVQANPVLHFWSLAVEEQFYLAWPLLLAGLFAVTRRAGARQRQVVRTVVVLAALASVLWAWALKGTDPNRAYYGTDARAYQLLVGAALALTPGVVPWAARAGRALRVVVVGALGGLVVLASSWVDLDAIARGTVATVLTAALIVALEAESGGIGRRLLSTAPMVYLGKISYGTYLWHWPVILVMERSFELSRLTTLALAALIATALASLSFQLLEHPIRSSSVLERVRTPVIAAGLALSVVSALVVIPVIADRADATRAAAASPTLTSEGFTPVPDDLDFAAIETDFPRLTTCYQQPESACTIVDGPGPHLLLMGDSHAAMMTAAFARLAREEGFRLSVSVRGGCPWQEGLFVPPLEAFGEAVRPQECRTQRADTYDRVIPALDPDVIVVMNLGYEVRGQLVQYSDESEVPFRNGSAEHTELLQSTTRRSMERLREDDRAVVVLEPVPFAKELDPAACLSGADVVEECRFVVDTEATGLEQLYRALDEDDDGVWSLDLDSLACPFLPICDPLVDGLAVRLDGTHLTQTYARSLADEVGAALEAAGVLAR